MRIVNWAQRGLFAVTDQALVGAVGFCATVVPGRVMRPDAYADFALAYALYLFLYAVHSAVVAEPAVVLSGKSNGDGCRTFFAAVRALNARAAAVLLGLSVSLLVLPLPSAVNTLAWGGVTASCSAPLWIERRLCYARGQAGKAVTLAASQLFLLGLGLLMVARFFSISLPTIMLVLGTSALVVGVGGSLKYRSMTPSYQSMAGSLLTAFARYGRGSLGAAFFAWLAANGGYFVLSMRGRVGAVAELRAAMNVLLPYQHAAVGLGFLILATVARKRESSHPAKWVGSIRSAVLAAALFGAAYGLILAAIAEWLVRVLYGDLYTAAVAPAQLAIALAPLWGAQAVLASSLRGLNRPAEVFIALGLGNVLAWGGLYFMLDDPFTTVIAMVVLSAVSIGLMAAALRRVVAAPG